MDKPGTIYYVMGVSGSGKTTLGKKLAERLQLPFFDGDDYHPEANIRKMSNGIPLEDEDRRGWLLRLNELARTHQDPGAVIACSALKEGYRNILEVGVQHHVRWVYLQGNYDTLYERMRKREGHYMPPGLLRSQFEALEPPAYGIPVPVSLNPDDALERVLREIENSGPQAG